MDIKVIDKILANSFVLSLIASQVVEKIQGSVLGYVREKFRPDTIEYQFIEMLDDSLRDTFMEYDDSAVSDKVIRSLSNLKYLETTSGLRDILEDVIEQPVDDALLDKWVMNIKIEITKPGREWLYRYIVFQNSIIDNRIKTSNDMYAKIFEDVMFLHKNSKKAVRLCDIFIPHSFHNIKHDWKPQLKTDNIFEYFKKFICLQNNVDSELREIKCLFIEGDAGAGKSSLVSYLAHMYKADVVKWMEIFGDRELICIRLRELIPTTMQFAYDSINANILQYLNMESVEMFNERHKNSVVILDGFDELCMIEKIHENANYYIYEIVKLFNECELIITTRPLYLDICELNFHKAHIVLKHFDKEKRREWINNYKKTNCEKEEMAALEYIESLEDEDTNGICDTPMAMYMLVAGRINEDAKKNHWVLYNQIFYKELSETEYNSVFPSKNGTYSHAIKKYSDLLYRISAEIAYCMYTENNTKQFLTNDEIANIINNMEISNFNIKNIVEHCYALCSYWKINAEKGVAEFYHNNIRDFFMCEKIFYEMESIYKDTKKFTGKELGKEVVKRLIALFSYAEINTKVIEFLYLRVLYQKTKCNINNFAKIESERRMLEDFFLGVGRC